MERFKLNTADGDACSCQLLVGKGSWKKREVGNVEVGKFEMKLEIIKF